jgi:hypothetical protein
MPRQVIAREQVAEGCEGHGIDSVAVAGVSLLIIGG